jgi:hypothetical protein
MPLVEALADLVPLSVDTIKPTVWRVLTRRSVVSDISAWRRGAINAVVDSDAAVV